jgi:hypothetical protein
MNTVAQTTNADAATSTGRTGQGGIVDHLFRHGGGFKNYGRPTFQAFCGACAQAGAGSHTEDEHDPEGFAAHERLRDAAPMLAEALQAFVAARRHAGSHGCDDDCEVAIDLWRGVDHLIAVALSAALTPADAASGGGEAP